MAGFGKGITVKGSFEEIKTKIVNALKTQGFSILTEIDVQKTLKEKIDIEFEPYQILGACNPHEKEYQAGDLANWVRQRPAKPITRR